MKIITCLLLSTAILFAQEPKENLNPTICKVCGSKLLENELWFYCNQGHVSVPKKVIKEYTLTNPSKSLVVDGTLRPVWNFHQPKDPFKAGVLSFFMPSGGHIYNEEFSKAALYLFAVPILYISGSLVESNNLEKENDEGTLLGIAMQLSALFFHFYNVYDAVMSSHRINKEYLDLYVKENQNDYPPPKGFK